MWFCILLLTLVAAPQVKEDWLRFRGPNGSGVSESTGVPAEFDPSRNVLWKTPVPFGRSSPIVAGSRIFLTAAEGEKLITLCLDRQTGKIIWRSEVTRVRHMPIFTGNDAASPTPVSDGTNVYVFFAELGLISYGPYGKERWRVPLGPFNSFYGLGASPVMAGDTVVMVCDQRTNSFVIAVDARDGKVRWQIDRPSPVEGYATPVIYSPPEGEPQLLVFGSHALEARSENRRASLVGPRGGIRAEGRAGGRPRAGVRQRTWWRCAGVSTVRRGTEAVRRERGRAGPAAGDAFRPVHSRALRMDGPER
jgi:hypothetical protein